MQVVRNMIMSLTLKMKGGLRVRYIPLGEYIFAVQQLQIEHDLELWWSRVHFDAIYVTIQSLAVGIQ